MSAVSGKLAEPGLKSTSDVAATLILIEASVKMLPQNVPGKESYSSWVVKAQQIKPPHTKTRRVQRVTNGQYRGTGSQGRCLRGSKFQGQGG